MSNNFFLEGPIQTGKSTLIRRVIDRWISGEDLDQQSDNCSRCGGFITQRVVHAGNVHAGNVELFGFRLVSLTDDPSAPIKEELGNIIEGTGKPGIIGITEGTDKPGIGEITEKLGEAGFFRYKDESGGCRVDLSPFTTIGLDCLELRPGQRFLLLDEIGGVELGLDGFRDRLHEVLRSDIPCIGVIKLTENAQRIHHKDRAAAETLMRYYDELHGIITSGSNSSVEYFERIQDEPDNENGDEIKMKLKRFLDTAM
jgi:nucleoside-triphosphatase THEP1